MPDKKDNIAIVEEWLIREPNSINGIITPIGIITQIKVQYSSK